jgi:ABC-type nitrate/sulfonate/bicarbonate transport system permease component
MLTQQEEQFVQYWQQNRNKQKKSFFQFIKGFYRGLAVCLGVISAIALGWNERANMVANAKMSTLTFIAALILIALFMAWLYHNFTWEMKEQQYLEYLAKNKQTPPSSQNNNPNP